MAKQLDMDVYSITVGLVRFILHGIDFEFELSDSNLPEPLTMEGIRMAQEAIGDMDKGSLYDWQVMGCRNGFTERELTAAILLNTLERDPALQRTKMDFRLTRQENSMNIGDCKKFCVNGGLSM